MQMNQSLYQLYCGHFCTPSQLCFCSDTCVASWALTVPLRYFSKERSDYSLVIYIRKRLHMAYEQKLKYVTAHNMSLHTTENSRGRRGGGRSQRDCY